MTAQIPERLIYRGEQVPLCTNPLGGYFELAGIQPSFEVNCTALWRGYVGTWEIIGDRLYLVGIDATLTDGSPASLATFFPGFPDRVFAHWYNGTLRIPQGKLLDYVHGGYASKYEQDLLLDIELGVVVRTRWQHNGIAAEDAPDGYSVAALTTVRPEPGKPGPR